MEVTDDLLRREQRVVANVVDRDSDAERSPACSIETQLAGGAPGLGFESLRWFAKKRLLGRVDDPRPVTIERDDEVLVFAAAVDRTADSLGRMVASGDADRAAGGIINGFDLAVFVQLEQVAIGAAGSHPTPGCDSAGRDFDEVNRIGWPADTDHRPLSASLGWIFAPQDLGRSVGLRLQRVAAGLGDVGEAMPRFCDIDLGRDDSVKDDSTDFAIANRFDRDTNSAGVFIFRRQDRFDGRVTDEAGQFNRTSFGIRDRRIESGDAANRDDGTRRVVNANGRCVSQMRSRTTAAGQTVAMRRLGRRQQSVVFDRGDVETVAGSNTSCHLRKS